MNTDHSPTHWVLLGPKGRQAGRKDQHLVALKIVALQLSASGEGGGIADLLTPKSTKELNGLKRLIDLGYSVKQVKPRSNLAKDVREAVMSDKLIAQLAVRFELDKAEQIKHMQAVSRSFSEWICKNLTAAGQNDIKILIRNTHPELENRIKPGWWQDQIGERVKKLKKVSFPCQPA